MNISDGNWAGTKICEKKNIKSIATALVSQYGDDASAIAMLRAAEFAANLNQSEWIFWEKVIVEINNLLDSKHLDS